MTTARDLTDAELDELSSLLAATPAPLTALDVPLLDGYLVGTLVQPHVIGLDDLLPAVFDGEGRELPEGTDPAWRARTIELIHRRREALNADIAENGFFDPVLVDADEMPPVSEYEPASAPASRVLMPWAAGFQWAQDCFPELEDEADDAVAAALARIYRHLPAETDEQREQVARLERERPLKDLDAAIEDLVAACVELWDATAERRFAVTTVRRDAPKVGRNDPCPCGSGKKFKACHGKA